MDWNNSLRSIAPTVDADVLAALAATHEPVTGNRLAQLAGRSYAQTTAVVHRLVREGLVLSEQHGRTFTYVLNRDHALAAGIIDILGAPRAVTTFIAESVERWEPPAVAVAMFGSAARREAVRDSDIDLLLVRSATVPDDHERWTRQVGDLVRQIEHVSGNRVHLVELSEPELEDSIHTNQPLVESLRQDAHVIYGDVLRKVLEKKHRPTT